MNKMKIEIWSDIACPYCYIGKRKLENALEQFPQRENIQLVWHSYELDPTLPKKASGEPHYVRLAKNYGISEAEAKQKSAEVIELAKEVGLNYNYDILINANTSDALRLVKLANESGLATEAEEVLFKAYFIEGKDISDRSVLLNLGKQIGVKEEDINKTLDSDKYLSDIKKDMEYSEQELKLEYIPFYVFNNKHIVQGSIPSEDYLNILTKSYAEWEKDGVASERGDVISGQSCSIDGVCT